MDKDKTKLFLDYLDKEMTIMGILSAFCIAAASLLIDKVIFGTTGGAARELWDHYFLYCSLGLISLLVTSLFFYLQRSRLASHYRAIANILAWPEEGYDGTDDLIGELNEANSAHAWSWYKLGFITLSVAAIELGFALFADHIVVLSANRRAFGFVPFGVAIIVCTKLYYLYSKYRFEERPLRKFFR